MKRPIVNALLQTIEWLLWIGGSALLIVFLGNMAVSEYKRTQDIAAFKAQQFSSAVVSGNKERLQAVTVSPGIDPPVQPVLPEDSRFSSLEPDQSLWSPGRITAYAKSITAKPSAVIGVFTIPRLDLEVPLYDDASELHMDRGVARIRGTAQPGQRGNLGIAGHRDGYFRVLKDIKFGDSITLTSATGEHTYTVQQLMIVDPSAVEVLEPTDETAITLVTCYPFYFVGDAPERFIVRAVLEPPVETVSKR